VSECACACACACACWACGRACVRLCLRVCALRACGEVVIFQVPYSLVTSAKRLAKQIRDWNLSGREREPSEPNKPSEHKQIGTTTRKQSATRGTTSAACVHSGRPACRRDPHGCRTNSRPLRCPGDLVRSPQPRTPGRVQTRMACTSTALPSCQPRSSLRSYISTLLTYMSTFCTVILYHRYFVPFFKPYFVQWYKIKPRMYKISRPGIQCTIH